METKKREISKDGIDANVLFSEFKENSVADFFKKNRQMLGLYGKQRTLTTIIHEIVTNSLDACEEAGILPEIEVKLNEISEEFYEISVIDNGPGIPENKISSALGKLLAGTKFHRLVQTRGQQGIGVSGIILFSQITTGKTTKVISGTSKSKTVSLEISIDSKKNTSKVTNKHYLDKKFRGLAIKCKFKEIQYKKGQNSVDEYLRRTAISNPHANIIFTDPNGETTKYTRTLKTLPDIPKEVKPHPKGLTVDELVTFSRYTKARKISSFLAITFDRFGQKAIDNVQKLVHFDINKDPRKMTWDEAEEIIKAIKQTKFIAPNTDNLVPIGDKQIEKSLKTIVEPEYLHVVTRKPSVYKGGYSFQIEVGIAYGGNSGRILTITKQNAKKLKDAQEISENEVKVSEIIRYANKAPLLFDAGGCAITKTIQSVDWKRYGMPHFENAPITVLANIVSVHIPYTSAGKSAIADEDEIVDELKLSLMEAARRVGSYITLIKKEKEKKEKRKVFKKYTPFVVESLAHITGEKKDILLKNLDKMVLEKLKIEEENDQIEAEKIEDKLVSDREKDEKNYNENLD